MPEGDIVWRTARRLDAALSGYPLTGSDFRWPSLAEVDLAGRTVVETVSAGKNLLTRVEGGLTVHSHLRMEGSWHVHATGRPDAFSRSTEGIRVVLATPTWTAVGHRLGMLDVLATDRETTVVGHLGPDVLGPGWDVEEVQRRMAADPGRAVGEALLDQRVLAGVGTYYMAETCFLVGVTPWTPVGAVADLARLLQLVHRLLDVNKDRSVQATTGDLRAGRQQWVHARSGRPCRRCGATVRVAMIGPAPRARTAFYCPRCQSGPVHTGGDDDATRRNQDDDRPGRPLGAGVRRPGPARGAGPGGRRPGAGPRRG